MSSIFVKVVDQAVSEKQLLVEINKVKSFEVEGVFAERIVKNLEELLGEKKSFKITAGAHIFSNDKVLMEEVFDIFESQKINDTAYYYKISTLEGGGFEIYCKVGDSAEIKKL